jgi:hypothetical protein
MGPRTNYGRVAAMTYLFRTLVPTCLIALVLSGPTIAGVIDFPPMGNNFQDVAANVPSVESVWTGIAQSFTAQDPNVLFGFYVGNFTGSTITESLLLSVYSGDGVFADLLQQASTTVNLTNFTSTLAEVDFSSISLTPGQHYTVVASLPSQGLPPVGTRSDIGGLYNSLNNSYAGGRFYFVGASYDESLPEIANRDLAFRVTPVSVVSEPETLSLLVASMGAGLLVFSRRRRRLASAGHQQSRLSG